MLIDVEQKVIFFKRKFPPNSIEQFFPPANGKLLGIFLENRIFNDKHSNDC